MTKTEFEKILQFKKIKEYEKEYRLKGYRISFDQKEGFVFIYGKLPLIMVQNIFRRSPKQSVYVSGPCFEYDQILYHSRSDKINEFIEERMLVEEPIRPEEWDLKERIKLTNKEELFIDWICLCSKESLVTAIDHIREANIINAWAIGNN